MGSRDIKLMMNEIELRIHLPRLSKLLLSSGLFSGGRLGETDAHCRRPETLQRQPSHMNSNWVRNNLEFIHFCDVFHFLEFLYVIHILWSNQHVVQRFVNRFET